jgi:peptidylprolyl isomerase
MKVEKGNIVKVEYEGKLQTGEVFDSSKKHGQPLEFEAGAVQVIKGFDEAIIGMEVGEEKEITIKPEDAYGVKKDEMIKEFPKERLPKEREPKVGDILGMQLPTGQQMSAVIVEVTKDIVKLDLNHPLADKTLIFKIKIVDISEKKEEAAKEEKKAEEPKEEKKE